MAFLAYFGALSAMGAFIFGLSILLEPGPVPSSVAKKAVVEQQVKTPLPPPRPIAVKPADETVTEPPLPVTAQDVPREDDEAAPSAVASVPQSGGQEESRAALASDPVQEVSAAPAAAVSAARAVAAEKPKARRAARKKTPTPTIVREDGTTRTLRYVGVRDGIPTYVVER